MRVAALVALAGLVALVVALLTGSTLLAILVVALAALGIVLLLRDWRTDWRTERRGPIPALRSLADDDDGSAESAAAPLSPDMFSPDISGAQDGPSSDARADQLEGSEFADRPAPPL